MYVCLCNAITDRDFCAHATDGNCTVSTIYRSLGAKASYSNYDCDGVSEGSANLVALGAME